MSSRVPWTRVKFRQDPYKSSFKNGTSKRPSIRFLDQPRPSNKIHQYMVIKPINPISVTASDIDKNDLESMAPRHFHLEPDMILRSGFNIKRGPSVGYLTFGLKHKAEGNTHYRTYNVTVDAEAVGDEIMPFTIEDRLHSMTSRRPAGSITPVHPSRVTPATRKPNRNTKRGGRRLKR